MAIESSNTELRRILDAIRSSDVVESRIQLLEKLGEINISETSDLGSLIDCLTAFWEDYTCLDVTQCMFNKAILSVGSKHLNSDMSSCASQFLSLGTKASEWCGKHLKMTLMSSEESQEEDHANLFFQLLLDLLNFSAAICSALARSPILVDKASMDVTEKFILEQLILTKDSISESKRIQSHGSDVIKAGHVVIDSIIRLCGAYSQSMNWNEYHEKVEEKSTMDCTEANNMNHLITITQSAIEKLHEIGLIAANNGGNLVSILNVSWKGVVTLLQLGGGVFGTKVNVANIILTLISLVNETLKTTAEAWSSSVKETVSVTEARRKFLPVKFYLINAVKVSCLYPCQAFTVHTELTLCILVISTFKLSMSNRKHLKTASEVYTELLERTSFDLLNSLLCSDKVSQNSKLEVLDCVFITETVSSRDPNDQVTISIMDAICSVASQGFDGVLSILHGRVALFLTLLRYSDDLEEDIKVWTSRKLGWILDSLVDETVYSAFLVLQIPVLCSSGKNVELVWEPLFSLLLDALKAFAINVSSSVVWTEVESFLLENLFHPHFLCSEIVIELMCFIVRYAEPGMLSRIVEKLCLLMKSVASSDSVIVQNSGMRRLARTISLLLCYETESMVDQVFKSVIDDDRTQLSSVVCLGLLMEGFPIHSLSAKMRNIATQRILTDYFVFIDGFKEKSVKTSTAVDSGFPVFALSASLQSLKISLSDIDVKTLTFLLSVINSYKVTDDKATKKQYSTFLSETLGIISNMKHLYTFDEMEQVVFELENLFVSGPKASNKELYNCKPNLALFISGLAHMKITVSGTKSKFSAACELYHMMLRERHWALIHLAITAFGYFSARTSCDELWRFVPHDAALSFDLLSGTDPNEERFMSAFKVFLDKEATLDLNASSSNQIQLLAKEGHFLKEMFRKVSGMKFESIVCQATAMEIDIELNNERQQKKRKLPDSLNEGMQLIQTGLKVIVNGLSQWKQSQPESSELQTKFMTHCSRLEDEIARLVGLAGNN